jgi:hypothetical protein
MNCCRLILIVGLAARGGGRHYTGAAREFFGDVCLHRNYLRMLER